MSFSCIIGRVLLSSLIGFDVHAAKSLENPRKMLDQAVSEMREDLVKMRQASAEVMSTQKMLESKYGQAQASAVSHHVFVFITSWQMHKAASLRLLLIVQSQTNNRHACTGTVLPASIYSVVTGCTLEHGVMHLLQQIYAQIGTTLSISSANSLLDEVFDITPR